MTAAASAAAMRNLNESETSQYTIDLSGTGWPTFASPIDENHFGE